MVQVVLEALPPGQDHRELAPFLVGPQVVDLGRHLGLASHQDEPLAPGQLHGNEEALVVLLVNQLVPGRRGARGRGARPATAAWPCRAGRSRSWCTRTTTPSRNRRLRSRRPGRPPSQVPEPQLVALGAVVVDGVGQHLLVGPDIEAPRGRSNRSLRPGGSRRGRPGRRGRRTSTRARGQSGAPGCRRRRCPRLAGRRGQRPGPGRPAGTCRGPARRQCTGVLLAGHGPGPVPPTAVEGGGGDVRLGRRGQRICSNRRS